MAIFFSNIFNIYKMIKIKPCTITHFTEAIADIYGKQTVAYPWTSKETIRAIKGYTTDIFDCTAGGIVDKNTKEVTMFHICPTQRENMDFDKVIEGIMRHVDPDSMMCAFLVGSKKMYADSNLMFEKFLRFLKERVPVVSIKGNKEDKTDIVFDGIKNELLISNHEINSKIRQGMDSNMDILESSFDRIEIPNKTFVV